MAMVKERPKPLPLESGTTLYAAPEARRFYHLRTDCPCFKRGGAENLQVIGEGLMQQRNLQPCFFCGYEPPPPPTRKEHAVSILAAPLVLLSWPSGILAAASVFVALMVVLRLYHGGTLPLWAIILVGAGIVGPGVLLDHRFGVIEQ